MTTRKFKTNCKAKLETVQDFVKRCRLTPEDIHWPHTQPVAGKPELDRLRTMLAKAGFTDINLKLSDNKQDLSFEVRLTAQVNAEGNDALLRLWITAFRAAGFPVGFEEIGITDVDGNLISGHTLTGPIAEIAEHGAPRIQC